MASAVRKLTGVGGDIRKIARLLQKEAPPGHMLAYINQEEADLLKARGGSGKPHADTGVPSFEEEELFSDIGLAPSTSQQIEPQSVAPLDVSPTSPFAAYERATLPAESRYTFEGFPEVSGDVLAGNAAAPFSLGSSYTGAQLPPAYTSGGYGLTAPPASVVQPVDAARYAGTDRTLGTAKIPTITGDEAPADNSFFGSMSDKTKARLGIGGAQAVLGAYQISQATEQAKKYREDMAKLAQPYQAEGKKLIAQAQSGELTPAAQQQLQAAQAQAAQGAQARGGVGAQQAMMAVENMRQQLLQNQYDYGLKVSGIGDQIASGAIKAGMQADQYVNSLASSYASNIARTLSNAPTYVTSYSQNRE
jgi:hypothetical protein